MQGNSRSSLRLLLRRVRRRLDRFRPPSATHFRWLHVVDDHGAIVFGSGRAGLDSHPPDRLAVGAGVRVGDHVQVHIGSRGRVTIGDDAVIGSHVVVAADELVAIGAGCRVGDYSTLTDTWAYGREVRGAVAPPPAEPVVVGDGAQVGLRVVLGPGVEVPAGATVPSGTIWHEDLRERPA